MPQNFQLPRDRFEVDADRGLITQPRDGYDWPKNCSICCEPSDQRLEIRGMRRSVWTFLRIFLARYLRLLAAEEIKTWVYCCKRCKKRRHLCNAGGVVVTLVLFLVAGAMLAWSEREGFDRHTGVRVWGLRGGLAMLLLFGAPILGTWLARRGSRSPRVRTFEQDTITLRFPSREFIARMQAGTQAAAPVPAFPDQTFELTRTPSSFAKQ